MKEKKTVKTLKDFIEIIEGLDKPAEDHVRYYRGQSVDAKLIPSVLRDPSLRDKESEMYNDIINARPEEFENCTCTFDKLVKMQHYGLPTRLLDISSNPLVALYMACSDNPCRCRASLNCICNLEFDKKCKCYASKECVCRTKFDPTIYVIDIPKDLIKNSDSDSVAIISALAKISGKKKKLMLSDLNKTIEIWRNSLTALKLNSKNITDVNYDIKDLYTSGATKEIDTKEIDTKEIDTKEIEAKIKKIEDSIRVPSFGKELCEINEKNDKVISNLINNCDMYSDINVAIETEVNKEFGNLYNDNLLYEIRNDKPHFNNCMKVETLTHIYCVKPKMTDTRIIKQSGAFLLFAYIDKKNEDKKMLSLITENISIDNKKDIIDEILESLSRIDLNAKSLYADMDTITKSIKEKHQEEYVADNKVNELDILNFDFLDDLPF